MGRLVVSRRTVAADADALMDFLNDRGLAEQVTILLRERRLLVPAVAAFEVWCGARNPRVRDSFRAALRLSRIAPFDKATASRAGEIFRAAEAAGIRIAHRDCMIAAAALVARAPLLTRNTAHFARIPGLVLA
jgi:predicted nucleic acid-binding protein